MKKRTIAMFLSVALVSLGGLDWLWGRQIAAE